MSEREQRDMDEWIANHVTHWHPSVDEGVYWDGDGNAVISVPRYTTDPAAAMQVLEKCAQKTGSTPSFTLFEGSWIFTDQNGVNHKDIPTLALAICLFAKELFSK